MERTVSHYGDFEMEASHIRMRDNLRAMRAHAPTRGSNMAGIVIALASATFMVWTLTRVFVRLAQFMGGAQ